MEKNTKILALEETISAYKPISKDEYKMFYSEISLMNKTETGIQLLAFFFTLPLIMILIVFVVRGVVSELFGFNINLANDMSYSYMVGISVLLVLVLLCLKFLYDKVKYKIDNAWKENGLIRSDNANCVEKLFMELDVFSYKLIDDAVDQSEIISQKVKEVLSSREKLFFIDFEQMQIDKFLYQNLNIETKLKAREEIKSIVNKLK